MKTFSIDETNNITAHASRKEAKETGLPVFSTEEQLADAIGNNNGRLIEIWNSLPGVTPVQEVFEPEGRHREDLEGHPRTGSTGCSGHGGGPRGFQWNARKPGRGRTPGEKIETGAEHVGEQRAATEAAEPVATAGAQEPNVAPRSTKSNQEGHRRQERDQGQEGSQGEGRRPARGQQDRPSDCAAATQGRRYPGRDHEGNRVAAAQRPGVRQRHAGQESWACRSGVLQERQRRARLPHQRRWAVRGRAVKLEVYKHLLDVNAGFDQVLRGLAGLHGTTDHSMERNSTASRALSKEARAATNSYVAGVLEQERDRRSWPPLRATVGKATKARRE